MSWGTAIGLLAQPPEQFMSWPLGKRGGSSGQCLLRIVLFLHWSPCSDNADTHAHLRGVSPACNISVCPECGWVGTALQQGRAYA